VRPATAIAAVVFAIVALLHAARLAPAWEVQASGATIPMRVGAVGAVVAGAPAFPPWRDARR
jgi:hypothetical protein